MNTTETARQIYIALTTKDGNTDPDQLRRLANDAMVMAGIFETASAPVSRVEQTQAIEDSVTAAVASRKEAAAMRSSVVKPSAEAAPVEVPK